MKVERTEFGSIMIDGKTYPHDVIISLGGTVAKRKKKLSKKYYGSSHNVSKDEAEFVYEKGSKLLFLVTGQYDKLRLSPEATTFFKRKAARLSRSRHRRPSIRTIDPRDRKSACFM